MRSQHWSLFHLQFTAFFGVCDQSVISLMRLLHSFVRHCSAVQQLIKMEHHLLLLLLYSQFSNITKTTNSCKNVQINCYPCHIFATSLSPFHRLQWYQKWKVVKTQELAAIFSKWQCSLSLWGQTAQCYCLACTGELLRN